MKRKLLLAALCVVGALGMRAQTDVTSTYLANASFEGNEGTVPESQNTNAVSGWTYSYSKNDKTVVSVWDKTTNATGYGKEVTPANGTYYSQIRIRWEDGINWGALSQTSQELPAGIYQLSVKYKAASSNSTSGTGTWLTVKKGSTTLGVAQGTVILNATRDNTNTLFDDNHAWNTMTVLFCLTEASTINMEIKYAANQNSDAIFDDVCLVSKGTLSTGEDVTDFISNAAVKSTTGWTNGRTGSGQQYDAAPDNTYLDTWNDTRNQKQEVTLPEGGYTLKCATRAINSLGSGNIYVLKDGNNLNSVEVHKDGNSGGELGNGWSWTEVPFLLEEASKVTIGFYSECGGSKWAGADNFTLTYDGPMIKHVAEALPAGDMTADTWYYFDIASNADYDLTLTTLADIVYTTDGTILVKNESSVTSNFSGTSEISLTAGRYYVKSASTQTLTVTPHTFTYTVGDPTYNSYTQSTTITLTYEDAATNNTSATFQILDASKITVNDAAATASLSGKVLTITLTDVVTAGASYSVSVAAGAIGYNTDDPANYNTATSLTINTPAVLDGFYFLRNSSNKYVSRGGDYNSRAVVDEFGLPLSVATDATGITQFTYVDNGGKLFLNGSGEAYTDNNTAPDWTIETAEGGYYLVHANQGSYQGKKLNVDGNNKLLVGDEGVVWTFEPASEHNTYMEALKDAQAAAAATAIGQSSITTKSDLATWLDNNYNAENVEVTAVGFTEKWNGNASAEWAEGKDMYNATVTDLPAGLYKLTVNAYYRLNGSATAADGARGNVYLYGNDVKTQLYSIHDFPAQEAWSGNNQHDSYGYYPDDVTSGAAATTGDNYLTELYVYVSDGTLKYGIHQPSRFSNGEWFGFQNFTLTRYYQTEANMTVKAGKWGTFIAPFEVTIPTGYDIKAYTVDEDNVEENVLVLSEALSTIPANTPVVLKNSDSGDFSQSFSGQSIATADSYTEGLLTGVYTAATIASTEQVDNYVLQTQDAGQAFYKVTSDFTATPNRCYLSLQKSGANVRALFFPADGDATGIEAIGVLTTGNYDAIYTAGGAKVNSLQKGLNIVVKDGKSYKIFVK